MQSVSGRILLAYWVTTVCVITITNAMLPEHLRRPELIREATETSLSTLGPAVVQVYAEGGCPAVAKALPGGNTWLADSSGHLLCGSLDTDDGDAATFLSRVQASGKMASHRFLHYQLIAQPFSVAGHGYIVLLKSNYLMRANLFGWMPGLTTWVISGGVTLALALLITMPLRRLRFVARQIATGNLSARVRWGKLGKKDEMGGLMEDFNTMADRLQDLVDAQRLLLRDVSHELRSPLSRLGVALELARDQSTPEMDTHLNRIEWETTQLNNLISQLMSLSYMDTLRKVPQPVELSLNELVEELLPDVQYEAIGRRCNITATMSRDCVVCGDAGLLHRALENIVRNAIHYTPEHSVVKIDLNKEEISGMERAVLRVSDNGPGVPDGELEAILRPFYRVDRSRQASTGGFGIGLAIAERAVRMHEGDIVARNGPEGGLTVEIRLPLSRSA